MIRGFKSNPKDSTSTRANSVEKSGSGNSKQTSSSFERERTRQDFVVEWQMKPASGHLNIDPDYFH